MRQESKRKPRVTTQVLGDVAREALRRARTGVCMQRMRRGTRRRQTLALICEGRRWRGVVPRSRLTPPLRRIPGTRGRCGWCAESGTCSPEEIFGICSPPGASPRSPTSMAPTSRPDVWPSLCASVTSGGGAPGASPVCPFCAAGNYEFVVGEMASQPRPPLPLRAVVRGAPGATCRQVWSGCLRIKGENCLVSQTITFPLLTGVFIFYFLRHHVGGGGVNFSAAATFFR